MGWVSSQSALGGKWGAQVLQWDDADLGRGQLYLGCPSLPLPLLEPPYPQGSSRTGMVTQEAVVIQAKVVRSFSMKHRPGTF